CPLPACARARGASKRSRHRRRARGRRQRRTPPGRSRRGGSRAARPRGTAPRPSPRSAGSRAFRAERPADPPSQGSFLTPPWPRPECTVRAVSLVERWSHLEGSLEPGWTEATLSLEIHDAEARSRAAALLGPAGPGFSGSTIRFTVSTRGHGVGPDGA